MLLAEAFLLLVTDDTSGRLVAPVAEVDAELGGANLVELALMNKLDLSGAGDRAGGAASSSVTLPRPATRSSTRP
jgi:hypothetical protein